MNDSPSQPRYAIDWNPESGLYELYELGGPAGEFDSIEEVLEHIKERENRFDEEDDDV